MNDRDIQIVIQQAMIYKQCIGLELREDKITTEGIAALAEALRSNTTLLTLDLRGNDIPDAGVCSLKYALSMGNSTLKLLNLSDNDITDDGAGHLAEILEGNEKLTHICLDTNKIGNQGVDMLADVLTHRNTSLEQLYLNGNTLVNDLSVDSLVRMLNHNQSLKVFEISDCNLSEMGKTKLQSVEKPKDFKLAV